VQSDSGTTNPPELGVQGQFWDEWNKTWRFRTPDNFMQRQLEMAFEVVRDLHLHEARILDVGCGTGWFGNALLPFGRVWATDLSEAAIAEGRARHPGVQFVQGDFLSIDLPGPFDLVLSNDSLINMYDQRRCVERMATLLHSGGTLLLMTPHREVWRWRSALKPLGRGQVQHWLSKDEYLSLLRPFFTIGRVATIDPGGDRGPLWWVENRYVRAGMGLVLGRRRWRNLLEAAGLGRELVVVGRRV
jgi:SAM-dependent methyltransferase